MMGKCRKFRALAELVRFRWRRTRFRHGPLVPDTSGKVLCSSPYITVRKGICKLISRSDPLLLASLSVSTIFKPVSRRESFALSAPSPVEPL